MSWRNELKKGDFAIILAILLLAGAVFLPFALAPTQGLTCEITQDGETVRRIRLGAGVNETITLEGAVTNTIVVEPDSVYFASSDCPDQVCVHTGKLTRAGQTAVCLPNRVVVRLIGARDTVDAVAQ